MAKVSLLTRFLFVFTSLATSSYARADIAHDHEIAGRVAIIRRSINIDEAECLKTYRGFSCVVESELPRLIGADLSIGSKVFTYQEGNQEQVRVEFVPSANGYSLTVYQGNAEGPLMNYIKRSIRALPSQFEAVGLQILPDSSRQ